MPRWRAGLNGAAIDHQTGRRDQIEAAIRWIQARERLFKRIAALQARIDVPRAKRNGKTKAPQVGEARAIAVPKRNR